MTLTVDTRQVKSHKTVCYKPKTKANYREVYARHKFLNANNPLTLKDVEDNIGLITNVAKETRGRWLTRIAKDNFQSILYSLEKEEKHI